MCASALAALVLGGVLGSVVTPSGTASRGGVGLGFLPEPGWFVLQSGARASTTSPAVAVASNVPFAPEDDVGGGAESSALPYSTLLGLPSDGVVITVTFTPRGDDPWHDRSFSPRELPLRLPPELPQQPTLIQPRSEEPLGVHRISAAVNDHNLDIHLYFGVPRPSAEVHADAERQLARLVVRADKEERRPIAVAAGPAPLQAAAVATLDRTYSCTARASGGIYEIEARARAGIARRSSGWTEVALAALSTGTDTGGVTTVLDNELAWVTAGRPSAHATVVPDPFPGVTYPVSAWGTVAVNAKLCKPSSKRIPLTSTTLGGGAASQLGDDLDCATPRRVLVRIQATLPSTKLKRHRDFLRTTAPAREARLAVRTEAGKALVYAEVGESGRAQLYTARTCSED